VKWNHNDMAEQESMEYRLQVGEAIIGIDCPSHDYAESMARYFGARSCSDRPDIRLKLRLDLNKYKQDIPDSLFIAKRLSGDGFSIGGNLVRGRFRSEERQGELRVNTILTNESVTRVFEQLLYQAFYSVQKIRHLDAFLVHSAGVICQGNGFCFVGRSGSGKTTVANLSRAYQILNDEICMIALSNEDIILCSTPFNGYFREKTKAHAPLRAVLLLTHGRSHRLEPVSNAQAVATVFSQIVPPVGLEDELTQQSRLNMLELAERLVGRVPIWRLEFLPDHGFWNILYREFQLHQGVRT
jgi:hypothetical protein